MVLGSFNASRKLHRNLVERILRLPMSFFDSQPSGRLLNRFSRDTESLDTNLMQVRTQCTGGQQGAERSSPQPVACLMHLSHDVHVFQEPAPAQVLLQRHVVPGPHAGVHLPAALIRVQNLSQRPKAPFSCHETASIQQAKPHLVHFCAKPAALLDRRM